MAVKQLGQAGVASGWRKAIADRVTPPLARRTPLDPNGVRAVLGLAFVAISAVYLGRSLLRAARS